MCATFYSTEQLCHAAGITLWTVQKHIRLGWITAVKERGVKGYRVPAKVAKSWLAIHFPTVPVAKLDEPLPPKPEWKTPSFDWHTIHLKMPNGTTACGIMKPAIEWREPAPTASQCFQCLGAERKLKKTKKKGKPC
jgi:hypothetical protein